MSPTAEIRFAAASDGTSIAYRARGAGPDLLFARGWISHLEHTDDDPSIRAFFSRLERHYRVVRYDGRGNGLSDRHLPEPLDFGHLVDDLSTVADATVTKPFVLWASSWAGPAAVRYAVEQPDNVDLLILDGTFAHGPTLATPERQKSFLTMLETSRFQPDAVYASMSYLTDPEPGMPHTARVERVRRSIEPDALIALHHLLYRLDVVDLLEHVVCPTLIMHRTNSKAVSIRAARELATGIAGSHLVELTGADHNMWEGDTREMWDAVAGFLGVPELKREIDTGERTRDVSVVFIDQVASTDQMRDLGDERGVELQSAMIEMLGHAASAFEAETYKDTGDGVVFLLEHPADAVALAQVVQRRTTLHNKYSPTVEQYHVRVGVHTGSVRRSTSGRTSGLTIAYASRLCDLAGTGEIVISKATRDVAEVSLGPNDFTALDAVDLKGIGPAQPYHVTW